tara:strand:- start:354 stop:662 length:309 start_codon:yes stop_codon:yes gene_type:complete
VKSFFQLRKTIIIKIIIKEQKDKIFNKNNKKKINGLDIRRNIASKIWGDKMLASQVTIESISFKTFEYIINFKIKSEGKTIFTIHLKYGKVIDKKYPSLRLL